MGYKTVKRAFIFDLDGVLVFTDRFHYLAWKTVADEKNIFFDEKINDRLRGVSRMDSLEILLERYDGPPLSEAEKKAMAEQKNEIYRSYIRKMKPCDVAPDVLTTLLKLREKGFLLAVGSSSKNAGIILQRTKLRDCFDAVSDGNNISRSKPDPEVFLAAAEMLKVAPEECFVVEDAAAGIAAARAAGMTAVGIGDAASCPTADFSIKNIGELLHLTE